MVDGGVISASTTSCYHAFSVFVKGCGVLTVGPQGGDVASLLYMVFVREGMGVDEGTRWVRDKLERSWRKLSPPAQEMLRQQYQAALVVLGGPAGEDSTAETQRARRHAERD